MELVEIQSFCSNFNVLCNPGNFCLQFIPISAGAPWGRLPHLGLLALILTKKKRFKNINVSVASVVKVARDDRRAF